MYEEFYGFVQPPFTLAPDPRFLYRSESHDEALTGLSAGYFRTVRQVELPTIFPKFLFDEVPKHHGALACEGSMFKSKFAGALTTMMAGALGMANAEPLNVDGERGCIILTASVAAQDGQIGQVIYGSCKAGVNGLVLPMARDLMDLGIRVNSIMPGIFATPLMLGMKDRNPAMWDQLNASVPFPKRLGLPEEYASLALEMLSNGYFNGEDVRLDGAIRMAPR